MSQLGNYVKFFSFILKYYNSSVLKSASDTIVNDTVIDVQENYDRKPQELVEDLKQMGPAYVKLGQLLSTRPDLLPDDYLLALSELQDDVETISFEEIRKIFEEETGARLSKAFQSFDPEPLASASIGQVHRAVLPSGRWVVVKIQRPDIRKKFIDDLDTLREMAALAVKHSKEAKKYDLTTIIEELRIILLNELDYTKEFQNLEHLRYNLRNFPRLIIPEPVQDYSTSRVLTMDYIQGKKITEISPLTKTETDFTPLIDELTESYMQQIIVDGLVHADPHPGNIHVTGDGKMALMDLGMVARFSTTIQEKIMKLLIGMSRKNGDEITDALLEMSEYDSHEADVKSFRKEINRLVMNSTASHAEDMQTGRALIHMNRVAANHFIRIATELNILGKIMLNLDQIIAVLTPKYDLQQAIQKFMDNIVNQKIKQDLNSGNIYSFLLDNKKLAENLPYRLNKISENLANNEFELRINALDEKRVTDGFQKVANRITSGLIIAAMIIGAALLMRIPSSYTIMGYGILPFLFFMIAIGLGLYLIYNILFKDEDLKKRK
ncbi:AarF/ABC1/UbiB kinase family protein [Chryseobacterium lacus]|uniref:AarF/ABC1/UbiB kinase family protein n=1 Tax=Chryseobacterium lacus TaxID=2058346 RepID=A0A368MYR4_9FLAO|nr:AarF/UbiB family protein [Chryseobacterium lacus]RCU42465.1 AarF/ABC1/UbiB kinase family protein [Chryseobacterium lacus]RST27028.1 AarF/ABC1/UbiB kinase family protein [Chryseobacterium lacus]